MLCCATSSPGTGARLVIRHVLGPRGASVSQSTFQRIKIGELYTRSGTALDRAWVSLGTAELYSISVIGKTRLILGLVLIALSKGFIEGMNIGAA